MAEGKHPGGRPPKLTPEEREEVYKALELYIQNTEDPTLPDFETSDEVALQYNINDSNLYDWEEFSGLIKRCVRKQEAYLLKKGGKGEYNPTMAIFRLKQPQHGYRDRTEVETTGEVKHTYEELDDEQLEAAIKAREDRVSEAA